MDEKGKVGEAMVALKAKGRRTSGGGENEIPPTCDVITTYCHDLLALLMSHLSFFVFKKFIP